MQPDIEIYSRKIIKQEKYFSSKIMQKNETERLVPGLFFVFKNLCLR